MPEAKTPTWADAPTTALVSHARQIARHYTHVSIDVKLVIIELANRLEQATIKTNERDDTPSRPPGSAWSA